MVDKEGKHGIHGVWRLWQCPIILTLLLLRLSNVGKFGTEAFNHTSPRELFLPLTHLLEKLLQSWDLVVCDSHADSQQQISELLEGKATLGSDLFNDDFLLRQLPDNIDEHVRCECLDREVVEEDFEVDSVIVLVALESQVLLKSIDICHVKTDVCFFEHFEQLLVAYLLGPSCERLNDAIEQVVL